MPLWTTILSTIRLPKNKSSKSPKSSISSKRPTSKQSSSPNLKTEDDRRKEDDQRILYATIETWLSTTKDAPPPGHRFNGHTLGQPKLTPRNLAMLDDGLRPMPDFGPEALTRENLGALEVGMGPFGNKVVKAEGDEASESGATTGSSRLSA